MSSFKAIKDGAGNDITPLFYWCEAKPQTEPKTDTNTDDSVGVATEDKSSKDKESGVQTKSPGKQLLLHFLYFFFLALHENTYALEVIFHGLIFFSHFICNYHFYP